MRQNPVSLGPARRPNRGSLPFSPKPKGPVEVDALGVDVTGSDLVKIVPKKKKGKKEGK